MDGLCPGAIDARNLNAEEDIENCELGVEKAFDVLAVPKLISGVDMSNPGVDQLSMMTYLSGFISPFEKMLLDWVNEKIPEKEAKNLSTDWNSGDRLRSLVNAYLPGFWGSFNANDKDSLQGLLNKIQAELPTNYPMTAEKMMDPAVDNLEIGCYLFRLKERLEALPKEDPNYTQRKEELMLWVNSKIPHHKASNFTTDWDDGTRLRALMNTYIIGFHGDFDHEGGEDGSNYQQLLDKIDSTLDYPSPLSAAEFANPKVDEKVVVQYLWDLRDKLEAYLVSERERRERERLAMISEQERLERERLLELERIERDRLAQEAIDRQRLEEEVRAYEKQKADLLTWVNEMVWPVIRVYNFEADWRTGDTMAGLLNSIRPNVLPEAALQGGSSDKWDNALRASENGFGVRADFTGLDASRNLDERRCVGYVGSLLGPFNSELLEWANTKLSASQQADNFGENWQSGVRLAALIEAVAPGFVPADFDSGDPQQGQELLARVHRDLGNRCPFRYQEIINGNFEPAIMAAYINRFRHVTPPYGKQELLLWLNCMIAPIRVDNLTTAWSDGVALRSLLNVMSGDEVRGVEASTSSKDDVCKEAIDGGVNKLGILARNFSSHEMALGNVDEYRMRQYLSKYRDTFMQKNESTAQEARAGVELALEDRNVRLNEEETRTIPLNDKVAMNRALLGAASESYIFSFPADNETLYNLDRDIHITTALLHKLKSAPKRASKVVSPVLSRSSSEHMEEAPYPAKDPVPTKDPELGATPSPEPGETSVLKAPSKGLSNRRKVQCCVVAILVIASLLIIAILVGTFIGLAIGVWNL